MRHDMMSCCLHRREAFCLNQRQGIKFRQSLLVIHNILSMVCTVITKVKYGSTGDGCQSCCFVVSYLNRGFFFFPCTRSRLRFWPRETGSAVPSRISPLILHTWAGSGAYSRDSSRFLRRRPFILRAAIGSDPSLVQ